MRNNNDIMVSFADGSTPSASITDSDDCVVCATFVAICNDAIHPCRIMSASEWSINHATSRRMPYDCRSIYNIRVDFVPPGKYILSDAVFSVPIY